MEPPLAASPRKGSDDRTPKKPHSNFRGCDGRSGLYFRAQCGTKAFHNNVLISSQSQL